jgi:putative ABC transport system permease protein
MLKSFILSTKLFWREFKAGEWFILFFALLLSISAVTTLDFYTDRLKRGLDQQSARFLGGDLAITSSSPIPVAWVHEAELLQLRTAEVWGYPSVVNAKNTMQLVNLQAVSNNYPLLDSSAGRQSTMTARVEPRLLPLMSLKMNDSITIGSANFRIDHILSGDVDTLNMGWAIAPRVMIRLDDVPATNTVLPGSIIDYRLLLVGEKNHLQEFVKWVGPQLKPSQRLLDARNQQIVLRDILDRIEQYLQLTILICIVMSGVAIALSVQQYMRRHYSHVALWRCLGMNKQNILLVFLWQFVIVVLVAGIIGVTIGYIAQEVLVNLFKDYLQFPMPAAGFSPVVKGFITSVFLLLAFAYPLISQLPQTSPLYLWRGDSILKGTREKFYFIISIMVLACLLFWIVDFSLLTLFFMNALAVSVGCLYAISLILLALIRRILVKTNGIVRRGLSNIVQHPESIMLQFTGFTLIVMLLLVLSMVRTSLMNQWQQSLPKSTPNYFAFNIAPSDIDKLRQAFKAQQVSIGGFYPMTRGRIIELNGKPIMSAIPVEARGANALHRELNLSWMLDYPSDNKIVAGAAWGVNDKNKSVISVEQTLAEKLHLHLGDELTFLIGEQKVKAIISNFRTLEWSSFHPNFYIIFPPGVLDGFPATYIASFYLASSQRDFINQIIAEFPNMTVIDVANILKQLQDLIAKLIIAIQYLFLFAFGAGVLIFIINVQASMDERRQTSNLLRVLGASKKYLVGSLMVEFVSLFVLILVSASILASGVFYVLDRIIIS